MLGQWICLLYMRTNIYKHSNNHCRSNLHLLKTKAVDNSQVKGEKEYKQNPRAYYTRP